ncbi:hypothetical protein GUITHDRAFT_149010 [Guillardia theta CCMP2712]|uniref:Uncharacterized protein n=1 Tax=Guillardia theta (strain CCMP2712) TaxID=905079 RepID=L1I6M8_GUITC|nr:hypothetical protein GUITHDRAFT_149010 [Guillardia theta CCMP2712]EKX31886.1 hypothetical protein GUITHDRAFT_149010 [Guillardia theta CCMP2712]|eukprot:XP_005818866.1 hypothetical protein GUITHDRAFT_149010 [Guillardia theta CCMP2712]
METVRRKKSDVTRIFWPKESAEQGMGLLVGWNVHSFTACVALVVRDVHLSLLSKALLVMARSSRYSHLFFECGGPPGLLGEYKGEGGARRQSHSIKLIRQTANFWLTLDKHLNRPRLCDIHCCGFRYSHASDFEKALMQINESFLVEQVLTEVIGRLQSGSLPSLLLREVGTWELEARAETVAMSPNTHGLLQYPRVETMPFKQVAPGSGGGGSGRQGSSVVMMLWAPVELLNELAGNIGYAGVTGIIHGICIAMLVFKLWLSLLHRTLDLPILPCWMLAGFDVNSGNVNRKGDNYVRIRQISALGRQLHQRIELLAASPIMSPSAWTLLQVCMVGFDLLLGLASCYYSLTHARELLESTAAMAEWQSHVILQGIRWLMGVPAGLKLNDNLDYCIGNLCILGVECYKVMFSWTSGLRPWLLLVTAVSGVFGMSIMLSLISDLISFFTFHVYLFYSLSARWHGVQTRVLSSLWRLFRGKKKNVLRGRIDACDYSLDQLLLGTMLFTLLVFLFPTTFVYYLFFFLLNFTVSVVQTAIRLIVSVLNHFPLFSVLLRLLDPSHLPGGARLELLRYPDHVKGLGAKEEEETSQSSPLLHLLPKVLSKFLPLHLEPEKVPAASVLSSFSEEQVGMNKSSSMPDLSLPGGSFDLGSHARGSGFTSESWRDEQPSPLRANERKRSSLVGRSSYFTLQNRALPVNFLFQKHMTRIAAVISQ